MPGCRGNYDGGEKVSVFAFPSDQTRRNLWLSKIPRADFQPTAQSVVCAQHFSEQFIIRTDSATRPDGSVLTVERTRPKLSEDAYPSMFPNCPSYLSEEPPKKRKRPEKRREEVQQRDECAFTAYLQRDKINSFAEFSSDMKCHLPAHDTWLCRFHDSGADSYWSLYRIHDSSINTKPTFVSAIRICADLHVEIFTDKENTGIGKCYFLFLVSINGKIKTGLSLGVGRREFSFVCKVQFCGCGFLYLFINLLI